MNVTIRETVVTVLSIALNTYAVDFLLKFSTLIKIFSGMITEKPDALVIRPKHAFSEKLLRYPQRKLL